jgi:hypothetical protein
MTGAWLRAEEKSRSLTPQKSRSCDAVWALGHTAPHFVIRTLGLSPAPR